MNEKDRSTSNVVSDQRATTADVVEQPQERRPFVPPSVQELGKLNELTQQFGGTI